MPELDTRTTAAQAEERESSDAPLSSDRPVPAGTGSPSATRGPEQPATRSSMHTEYGRLLRPLFRRLFGPIHYPSEAAERLEQLAANGTIVYVAHAQTPWLVLYFNHVLARLGLPLARFVGGISLLLWQPVDRLWHLWRQRGAAKNQPWRHAFGEREPTDKEALLAAFASRGEPTFLVLPRPPQRRRHKRHRHDYLRTLVAVQQMSARPIYLVPHVVTNASQPPQTSPQRLPGRGRLRQLTMFLSPKRATVRVGEALDLRAWLQSSPDVPAEQIAESLCSELEQRIANEERVITGPAQPSHHEIARRVLANPRVHTAMSDLEANSDASAAALRRTAQKQIGEIAARYRVSAIQFLDHLLTWVFNRIYDGIVVDQRGLRRVLGLASRGPVVFCPSHKSYVDFLVLSYVLWQHGVAPPHIAAGANLGFFPLGTLFRHAGAFFLRRSFRDDALYKAVFEAYVQELLRMGTAIEFFPEGTRSRTGKLLMPRFGMLRMVVDAWRQGARDDVIFVPVSIDYERIIEAGAYRRELSGGEKQREDLSGLLRTAKVLRSRFGRVHVQFGEPLSLAELAQQRHLSQTSAPEHDAAWRPELTRLGYRIMHSVGMICSVTPTAVAATSLLGHRGRGLAESALLTLSHAVVEFLETEGARLSASLLQPQTREVAVREAVQKMVEDRLVRLDRAGRADAEPIYRVPDETRITLDFHKNAVMNQFAPAAIVARSLLAHPAHPVPYAELHAEARFLSKVFKKEFIYRVDSDFDTHFDDTLAALAVRGFLDVHDDTFVHVRHRRAIALLSGLLDNFVEAYWVVALSLRDLRAFPLWDRELSTRALERARRAFLEGEIRRPEAACRTLIDTALSWMQTEGIVGVHHQARRKTLELHDEAQLEELLQRLDRHLDPSLAPRSEPTQHTARLADNG